MIYLDAAAILPTTQDVRDRLESVLSDNWANVSGAHALSRNAKDVLELAREKVAFHCKVNPDNIVFLSGATEALNLATQGYVRSYPNSSIYSSSIEHAGVYKTVQFLEKEGRRVVYIPVNSNGELILDSLDSLEPNDLVCVMAVNNEIGTVNDLTKISELVHAKGARLLVDAVQSYYTFLPHQITEFSDYSIFSGHKLGTPQGVGVLVIKDRASISPLSFGGSQEWELRPGSTPAYLCDSFAYVFERELFTRDAAIEHVKECKEVFITGLNNILSNYAIHGEHTVTSPHIVAVDFKDVEAQMLVTMLDSKGLCVSKGSACASGASTPSHVLLALGLAPEKSQSTIRFSFSRNTSIDEIKQAVDIVASSVNQLREFSDSKV